VADRVPVCGRTALPTPGDHLLAINVSVRAVEDLATGASRRVPERLLGRPAQSRRVAQAAVPGQADAHQGLSVDASRPEGTRRPERPARRVTGGRGGAALPGSSMAKGSVSGRRRGQPCSSTPTASAPPHSNCQWIIGVACGCQRKGLRPEPASAGGGFVSSSTCRASSDDTSHSPQDPQKVSVRGIGFAPPYTKIESIELTAGNRSRQAVCVRFVDPQWWQWWRGIEARRRCFAVVRPAAARPAWGPPRSSSASAIGISYTGNSSIGCPPTSQVPFTAARSHRLLVRPASNTQRGTSLTVADRAPGVRTLLTMLGAYRRYLLRYAPSSSSSMSCSAFTKATSFSTPPARIRPS
jgi:hypothetical protein